MEDFFFAVQQLERFPVMLSCFFAAVVYSFIKGGGQSGGFALVSIPVVIIGSLTSHYIMNVNSIMLANDKDTNTAAGVAIGMLVAFAVLMIGYLLLVLNSERRSAAKKLKPLSGLQRAEH